MTRADLRREIDRMCEELRTQVVDQADALEAQAARQGWTMLPARQWNADDLLSRAKRVYLRRVKKKTWGQIAVATRVTKASVVEQVGRWEAELELPNVEPSD